MQIAVSSAYHAQSDENQWVVSKRVGASKWEGIAHFHTAGEAFLWFRTQEPALAASNLSDLEWLAAAEARLLAEIGTHPRVQAIGYADLPRGWRAEIPGVATLGTDPHNIFVAHPWRSKKPLWFPLMGQALLCAWLYRVRRDPAQGGKDCVAVMESVAKTIVDWLATTRLTTLTSGGCHAIAD